MAEPYTVPLPGGIPPKHSEHTESRTTILLPTDHSAFLNPPQQFNRDLSVAVIRAWNERRIEAAKVVFDKKQSRRRKSKPTKQEGEGEGEVKQEGGDAQIEAGPSNQYKFHPRNIKIIEALSATGLRSIRYAKEIPNVRVVLANDLSSSACDAMRMNVAYNGVGEEDPAVLAEQAQGVGSAASGEGVSNGESKVDAKRAPWSTIKEDENGLLPNGRRAECKGKVRVNEGDACDLMYSHRDPKQRVDVVDLDPYGTAAPFIDAAIACIADDGLLCVTCTDVAVLAGSQYPEKAYANYGGASVNAEYCHEVGLRLVLNSLASAAARYGRCITPLLSFSIDFYVRVFVTVDTSPIRVKELSTNTGVVFVCSHCQSYEIQPFGRITEKGTNKLFKSAPKTSSQGQCEMCGTTQHLGGPMWLGPIQDHEFAERCLKSIEGQEGDYATWKRMHGMLLIAREELDEPFYFTCNKLSAFFKSTSAPTNKAVFALLNAGYKVSRSHASGGSIKTNAPREFIFDIMRQFVKENPVRLDKIPKGNPAHVLLSKEQTHEIDFKHHPGWGKFEKGEKVVFYQTNPLPNWGPAARAKTVKKSGKAPESVADAIRAATGVSKDAEEKRKSEDGGEDRDSKRAKLETEQEVKVEEAKPKMALDDEEEAMNG